MPHKNVLDTDLQVELARSFITDALHTKHRKDFNCIRCDKLVCGATLQWNFYNLCDTCFKEFNEQKMAGRLSGFCGIPELEYETFEFAEEWMKAHPFTGSSK